MDHKSLLEPKEVISSKKLLCSLIMVNKIDLTCIKVGIVAFSFSDAIILHQCSDEVCAYPFTLRNPE